VYEDSVSTFVKARDQLLRSIVDGLDVEDSAEEYIFAKANLQEHGYNQDITWRESICDSFVKSDFIPYKEYMELGSFDNDKHLSEKQPWRGRVRRRGASHHHDLEVQPFGVDIPYGDAKDHPFSEHFNPSKRIQPHNGRSVRDEAMIRQVLPTITNHKTHAKVADSVERAQDRILAKEKNPHYTGMGLGDKRMFHGIGPLGGLNDAAIKTTQDAYERDFQRWMENDETWKSVNPETGELDHDGSWRLGAIADAKAEGLSTEKPDGHFHTEEELALRKLHAEDRARSWNHKHIEYEEPEFTGYEDFDPEEPHIEHGYNLGLGSFVHQLQWFSPKERTSIMNTIKDGLDKPSNQSIKLPDGTTVSAAKIKNATHLILNQKSNWGGRTAGFTNENLFPNKETDEDLSKSQQDELYNTLHDVIHSDDYLGGIHEELREALGISKSEEDGNHYSEDGSKHNPFGHLPRLNRHPKHSTEEEIAEHRKKFETDVGDIINSGHVDKRLSRDEILYALGYDNELNEIKPEDDHHYPNYSGPLISREKLDEALKTAKSNAGLARFAKPMRNAMRTRDTLFFKEADLTPEEAEMMKDLKIPGSQGYYGLGAFFAPLFTAGGLNRNPHTLMEMMADHFADVDGESHIGTVSGSKLLLNDANTGLFGPYVGHRHHMFNTPQAILSKFHNTQAGDDIGSANTPKNQMFANVATFAAGLGNLVSGMSASDVKAKFGSGYKLLDRLRASIPFGSIQPHGKGYRIMNKKSLPDIGGTDLAGGIGAGEELESLTSAFEEEIKRDDVSHHQTRMGHSIGTALGRGTRLGRPKSLIDLTKQGMLINGSTFVSRADDLDAHDEVERNYFRLNIPKTKQSARVRPDGTRYEEEVLEDEKMAGTNHNNHMNRINSHHTAIFEMATVLAKLKPEGTFSNDNPNLNNEVDMIFREANLALMFLPRGYEIKLPDGSTWTNNLSVAGHGLDKTQTPIQQTGFKNLPSHMREKGFRVDKDTTLKELMKHIDMGDDHKHAEHYNNVLEALKSNLDPNNDDDHRLLMSLNSLSVDAPELYMSDGAKMFDFGDDILHTSKHMHHRIGKLRNSAKSTTLSEEDWEKEFGMPRGEETPTLRVPNPFYKVRDIAREVRAFRSNFRSKQIQDSLAALGIERFESPTEGYGKNTRSTLTGKAVGKPGQSNKTIGQRADYVQHALKDLLVHDPNVDLENAPEMVESELLGFGADRELHPHGTEGIQIMDQYAYTGLMDFSNHRMARTSHGIDTTFGSIEQGSNTVEHPVHPVPLDVTQRFGDAIGVPNMAASIQQLEDTSAPPRTSPNFSRVYPAGPQAGLPAVPTDITLSEPSDYASFLLNPDSLLMKEDDKPNFVPPIRPMHRIFNFKDMRQLRGFTGSWVVSKWYDGERVVVMKLNDKVSAYNEHNSRMSIPDWVKSGVKGLGEKDCTLDGILSDDELHIIDITYYDDTDVTDMTIQERLKILRGQYDGYNKVTVPGPHDTRMTDDEGLEDTVNTLLEEHDCLLIRDGKSTYMKGEKRHPKWVLLRPNKNVNLKILDKRGKNKITYRLGAGPLIDDEGIENATVDYEGEIYLDVGTVTSPKPFEEGEIVEVEVTGVKRKKMNGRELYDLNPVKIVGEGEGESSVSMETLNILAKSVPNLHFPHDIDIEEDTLVVKTMIDNDVTYTLEKSDLGYWVHSPKTVLSDMGESSYAIELSESLKPYWSQVASMMLKGKVEKRPIPEKKVQDKAKTLAEKNQLLKPEMQKALDVMMRALDVLEKGFAGHFPMSGTKGLGIDFGGGGIVESPRGPTTLDGEQTIPDYDMKERPTEDDEETYPHMKRQRKKGKGVRYNDSGEEKERDNEATPV
tara:strand:- start:9291 stop:14843 length:5553 start_codon:yes stop_codon:yes gene_type:complete